MSVCSPYKEAGWIILCDSFSPSHELATLLISIIPVSRGRLIAAQIVDHDVYKIHARAFPHAQLLSFFHYIFK
jgi:hypothetical protein